VTLGVGEAGRYLLQTLAESVGQDTVTEYRAMMRWKLAGPSGLSPAESDAWDQLEKEAAVSDSSKAEPTGEIFHVNIDAEVDRLFDESSLPVDEQPAAVIISGGVCAGKTTIRRQKYSTGYVLIDAADIFLSLSRGEFFPFPEAFREPMDLIGGLVALRALSERRNIVTEIVGAEVEPVQQLIDALRSIGYRVRGAVITCDIDEALRRNESRGDDDTSAYYAEPFQRAWIIDACKELTSEG
jgi:hypothetical protein